MKPKLCFNCIYRVVDVKDAINVTKNVDIYQWQCKRGNWQDMSICLECHPVNRDWAMRCSYFTKD